MFDFIHLLIFFRPFTAVKTAFSRELPYLSKKKKIGDPFYFYFRRAFAVLHAKFEIKILKNELQNRDEAREQCSFLLKILQKTRKKKKKLKKQKKEVIFSLYFALATLRTKFYSTTLKNREAISGFRASSASARNILNLVWKLLCALSRDR